MSVFLNEKPALITLSCIATVHLAVQLVSPNVNRTLSLKKTNKRLYSTTMTSFREVLVHLIPAYNLSGRTNIHRHQRSNSEFLKCSNIVHYTLINYLYIANDYRIPFSIRSVSQGQCQIMMFSVWGSSFLPHCDAINYLV